TISADLAALLRTADLPGNKISLLKLSGQKKRIANKVMTLDAAYGLYHLAYGPLDCAAYVIGKDAAARLLPYCARLFAPIDNMFDRSYDHGVPIHAILPYPVTTEYSVETGNPLRSDIG